jgi:hypothetical protein
VLQGDCKDGNDEASRAEHMSSHRHYLGSYYSNKNEKYWSCLQTGLIRFSGEWRRIALHLRDKKCNLDPDRLVRIPFVVHTSRSGGTVEKVGAGEVRRSYGHSRPFRVQTRLLPLLPVQYRNSEATCHYPYTVRVLYGFPTSS